MNISSQKTALLVIDVQKGFDSPEWGKRNNLNAETNIKKLISVFRKKKMEVIHIQHMSPTPNSPLRPNQEGNKIKDEAKPLKGELILQKNVNSAFIGTNLEKILREKYISTLVIVGLTTDHCISTTTRMAGNLGFKTFIVSDATATFSRKGFNDIEYTAEDIHTFALVSLHKEFASVISTNDLIPSLKH